VKNIFTKQKKELILKKNTEFTECNECFWEGYQNRNHLSICHSEHREESENSIQILHCVQDDTTFNSDSVV
ncbi:MAG: hypothetical protein J6J26_10165, partial [Bacteroides sp.]|nr:hypothetical protein [Bacteroides sp.]